MQRHDWIQRRDLLLPRRSRANDERAVRHARDRNQNSHALLRLRASRYLKQRVSHQRDGERLSKLGVKALEPHRRARTVHELPQDIQRQRFGVREIGVDVHRAFSRRDSTQRRQQQRHVSRRVRVRAVVLDRVPSRDRVEPSLRALKHRVDYLRQRRLRRASRRLVVRDHRDVKHRSHRAHQRLASRAKHPRRERLRGRRRLRARSSPSRVLVLRRPRARRQRERRRARAAPRSRLRVPARVLRRALSAQLPARARRAERLPAQLRVVVALVVVVVVVVERASQRASQRADPEQPPERVQRPRAPPRVPRRRAHRADARARGETRQFARIALAVVFGFLDVERVERGDQRGAGRAEARGEEADVVADRAQGRGGDVADRARGHRGRHDDSASASAPRVAM